MIPGSRMVELLVGKELPPLDSSEQARPDNRPCATISPQEDSMRKVIIVSILLLSLGCEREEAAAPATETEAPTVAASQTASATDTQPPPKPDPVVVTLSGPAAEVSGAIPAPANLYASGVTTVESGIAPTAVKLPENASGAIVFTRVEGSVSCCGETPSIPPDGSDGATDMNSANNLSAIKHDRRMFLAGVFVADKSPETTPEAIDFSGEKSSFTQLKPSLNQVFLIGDGRNKDGVVQHFVIPAGARTLHLGFADGLGFSGNPRYYDDNKGAFVATMKLVP